MDGLTLVLNVGRWDGLHIKYPGELLKVLKARGLGICLGWLCVTILFRDFDYFLIDLVKNINKRKI